MRVTTRDKVRLTSTYNTRNPVNRRDKIINIYKFYEVQFRERGIDINVYEHRFDELFEILLEFDREIRKAGK